MLLGGPRNYELGASVGDAAETGAPVSAHALAARAERESLIWRRDDRTANLHTQRHQRIRDVRLGPGRITPPVEPSGFWMNIAPGSRLGPYEILAPLGQGGMGEI